MSIEDPHSNKKGKQHDSFLSSMHWLKLNQRIKTWNREGFILSEEDTPSSTSIWTNNLGEISFDNSPNCHLTALFVSWVNKSMNFGAPSEVWLPCYCMEQKHDTWKFTKDFGNSVKGKDCCVSENHSSIKSSDEWNFSWIMCPFVGLVKDRNCGNINMWIQFSCSESCSWISDGNDASNWQSIVQWATTEFMEHVLRTFWPSNPSSPPRSTVMCSQNLWETRHSVHWLRPFCPGVHWRNTEHW